MKKYLLISLFFLSSNIFLGQSQIGSDINGGFTPGPPITVGDAFGWVVSMPADGSTIAVTSMINHGGDGYVKVYHYANGTYSQLGNTIFGSLGTSNFGKNISLSGDGTILAIGNSSY
ncbi:MAG: hypothetical protein ABI426_04125 [Flavobacterium sp.]